MLTRTEISLIAEAVAKNLNESRDELLNSKQCAAWLGITSVALQKRVERGQIPHTKKAGSLYFSKRKVMREYLKEDSTP